MLGLDDAIAVAFQAGADNRAFEQERQMSGKLCGAFRIARHQFGKVLVQEGLNLFLVSAYGLATGVSSRELGGSVPQPAAAKPALIGMFGMVRVSFENRQDSINWLLGLPYAGLV